MLLLNSFFFGILAALAALVFEIIILSFTAFNPDQIQNATGISVWLFLFFTAFFEEFFKFLFLWKNSKENYSRKITLLSAAFIGLGFASTEIFFHFFKKIDFSEAYSIQYLGLIFIHLLTTLLMGYVLFSHKEKAGWILSIELIALNILLHFSYNLLVLKCF